MPLPLLGGLANILSSFIGQTPRECAKVLPFTIDFSTDPVTPIDLTLLKSTGGLSGVQTIYIDNSNNDQPVSITTSVINQNISIGAGWQGFFPCFLTDNIKITIESTGTGTGEIILINVAMAAAVWPASASPASFPSGTLTVHDAILQAFLTTLTTGTAFNVITTPTYVTGISNTAGSITTGGTAQTILAALPTRLKYRIQNTDMTNNEILWVRDDGVAATVGGASFGLAPGATGMLGGYLEGTSTASISVLAATTGHTFVISQES